MAYNFWAQKRGETLVQEIQETVANSCFVEVFPIVLAKEVMELGLSVPLKAASEPGFEQEFLRVLRYLMLEKGFNVVDLYTGEIVEAAELSSLSKRILR